MLADHKMPWLRGITEVEVSLVLDDLSSPCMESAPNELTWGKWQLVNRFVDGQNTDLIPRMKVSPYQFSNCTIFWVGPKTTTNLLLWMPRAPKIFSIQETSFC